MAALSGFWHPVFGSTEQDPQDYADWDETHQQRYVATGANRLIVTPQSSLTLEDDVLDWIIGGSGLPTLAVYNRKAPSTNKRLWDLALYNSSYNQATTESYTEAILGSYDNDGYSNAIWGYVINHEDYYRGSFPYWKQLGWVVNKIASEKPGKAIIAVGNLSAYQSVDTFLQKLWASADGLMVTEKYVWNTGTSTQAAVQVQEDAWRFAADKSRNLNTGNPNKWMGIVSCHRELRNGTEYYRYPDKDELLYELLYTALGPIAHGGQGTLFFLFEEGWFSDPETTFRFQGVYEDEHATRRTYVTNAITRMNQVAGYLVDFSYEQYNWNAEEVGGSWQFETFPWLLKSVNAGTPQDFFNRVEICRFLGPQGHESYVICNRDPRTGGDKQVTADFNSSCYITLDGEAKGIGTTYSFTLPQGDVRVLMLSEF